ncbi:MAG TPA: monofunctional biosynthetic peptidoglycan transglycosylase [Terracidiphilus sp.]|nr:monofunctional biosynthetic peptidoglycan transglycosylase [Terracidiphilus sp.]
MSQRPATPARTPHPRGFFRSHATLRSLRRHPVRTIALALAVALLALWTLAAFTLLAARFIDPPTTAVHIERRLQAWASHTPYHPRFTFVPLTQISPNLQHAVIAAEDARFYLHHGFDWHQIQIAADQDMDGGRTRGASTLTQQLVKNLFFGTGRSFLRKGAEASLVPVAELVLGKRRILELYLNLVEWGPNGIYGADAASRYYYRTPPSALDRQQSAQLAAILPAPRKRRPERMTHYSEIIQTRMRQMGW